MAVETWQGLLANLGIIAILIAAWSISFGWTRRLPAGLMQLGMILAGGGCVLILMLVPFELGPGIFFDLRAVPVALSGFLGGPLVGCAVGAIAALYRFYVGAVGAPPGIIGIAVGTVAAIVAHALVGGKVPSYRAMAIFAAVTAVLSITGAFFLPPDLRWPILERIGPPSIVLNFVAMILVGFAVVAQLRYRQIADENALHRSLMDAFPEPLNAKDPSGRFIAANPATARLMRAGSAASLIGKTDYDFYPKDVADAFRKDEESVLASGRLSMIEQHVEHGDRSSGWISTLKVPILDWQGSTHALLTHNRDIDELKRLRDARDAATARLDDAMTHMADALVVFDGDGRLLLCNEQYRRMFPKTAHLRIPGVSIDDILRASIAGGEELLPEGKDLDAWIEEVRSGLKHDGENNIALVDGRSLHARVRQGSEGTALVVISDVTEQRRAARELADMNRQLQDLARTDGLTGLANRRTFDETLEIELSRSKRSGVPLTLFVVDLDFFKKFNDEFGHVAGDDCLKKVATAMRSAVGRAGDLVARYGGEEFAVILPATDAAQAAIVAQRLQSRIEALGIDHPRSPHRVVTISIGIATTRADPSQSMRAFVREADAALYAAKGAGRNAICRSTSEAGDVEVVPTGPAPNPDDTSAPTHGTPAMEGALHPGS